MGKPTEDVYRLCSCGSGKKYKFCCLQDDRERRRQLLGEARRAIEPGGKPLFVFDLEEAERAHELGMDLVQRGMGREAIPILEPSIAEAPLVPQPYNNLAMAYFLVGDPEKALAICEKVDRVVDPGNVFALGNRIHFLLVLGRRREAEEAARRISKLPGRDEFAVYKKCEALARLGRHDEVHDTATRGLPRARECSQSLAFYAGTAAANLARYEEAERYLSAATDDPVHGQTAQRYLRQLRRRRGPGTLNGDWPYLESRHWVSPGLLKRIKNGGEARKFPGMVEVLVCLLNEGDHDDAVIGMLGIIGTPEAFDVLRRIAFGSFGSDELRLRALSELEERDALGEDEPLEVWLKGHWQTIHAKRIEINPDIASTLPEEAQAPMGDFLEAARAEDWARAEALGRGIVETAPRHPQALYNFAVSLLKQGRESEGEELLRRAIEVDRTYLFAAATLARVLLGRGRTTEARAVLRSVEQPDKAHPDGYALFLLAQAEASLFEGNFELAVGAWQSAEKLAPDHTGVRAAMEGWARRVAEHAAAAEARRMVLERHRTRLLPRDAGVEACLADRTLGQLREMAYAAGLDGLSRVGKSSLLERVSSVFRDRGLVRALVQSLPERAKNALRHVRAAGWVCAYDEFTRMYGSDEYGDGAPAPLALLRTSGLVAEGTVGGLPSVVIPREVRPALDQAFSSSRPG
jgi:tetratricopeptide (TPR) repeat protein